MPSTPRLSTPDFSVTSSPSPASISGIAATTALAVRAVIGPRFMAAFLVREPGRPTATQAVMDEQVAAEQREQQQALEHAADRLRQLQRNLHRLAAEIKQRHQQARGQAAERMQPPDEHADDRGEAVARRPRRLELADRPGDFGDARE